MPKTEPPLSEAWPNVPKEPVPVDGCCCVDGAPKVPPPNPATDPCVPVGCPKEPNVLAAVPLVLGFPKDENPV